MKLPHLRSEQIKNQPDQTAALINRLVDEVEKKGGGGGGGTNDFDQLINRPSYNGTTMTGNTNIPAVPTKTSQLNNDSGFVNNTDLTNAISNHNTSGTAHSDIRSSITSLSNSVTAIQNVIPNTATSTNKLTDKNYVDDSINSVTAYYITKNAAGDPFATKAELNSATTFYSGGQVRIPTRNDYCIVVADESQRDPITGEDPTTRYIYNNGWEFQYIVNKTALTADQLAALNSGVTAADVTKLSGIEAGAEVNVQSDWTEADNTSDAYIKNKPTIGDATLTITQNGTSVGTFTANATSDVTLALTDTLYNDFTGATSGTAGSHGLVIAPAAGDEGKFLKGDGSWDDVILPNKVDVASTNIDNYSGKLIDLVKSIYPENYHRWATTTNAATANITDAPIANTSFVLEAYLVRNNSSTNYCYRVVWRAADGQDTYEEFITYSGQNLNWAKLTTSQNSKLYDKFVALDGTEIVSNSDLNARAFLDPGMYYTMADAVTATLTNCPTTEAITMRVYVPFRGTIPDIDNDAHVYLLREITTHTGKVYTQQVNSGSTPGVFTYKDWYRKVDSREIKSLNTQSDAGWSADKDKIPDMSMIAYWNGAYSGTASNLKYLASNSVTNVNLQDGSITTPKFSNFNTANTVDTWVPVAASGDIQHRVIKAFNADGSIPRSAMGFETPKLAVVNSNNGNSGYWKNLGALSAAVHQQGEFVYMKIFIGYGNNGRNDQNAYIELTGQKGWTGNNDGRYGWSAVLHPMNSPFTTSNTAIKVIATDYLHYNIWLQVSTTYVRPNILFYPTMRADGSDNVDDTTFVPSSSAWQSGAPSGTACEISYQQAAV